ncbi:gliding motility-associated C-terminal domain-containing protein [Altibacter sp.]|uniref:gliding motility-associated C-terminal domain-containing protein n=1 Tax=Altibacter sp. TaxID=2024823 RepID=UPI000C8B1447|nr:gliding motility-associated C-terminal domain-containing protein [Altibacter sp.]MAP54642.1 hypothetical protein [Altibacter sp.]
MVRKLSILLLLVLLFGSYCEAQVQAPFTVRFSESMEGDFTIIGNNMISRTPTGNFNGGGDNHNFFNNVYVDIDSDPATFNSSSANFSNPNVSLSCISVFKAYLYWAAADTEQSGGGDNQPGWNFDQVKLMLPGETTYTTITADEVLFRGRNSHFSNDPYICVKDISAEVTALTNKYGTYQVANVEAKEGYLTHSDSGTSGGWQIVFVYESPELPAKNISLFDGYAHVTSFMNNFDINFSGFQTTPSGPVNANMIIGALEGDRNLSGDRLQILNTSNNFVNLTAPSRGANNFFNSRITVGGGDFTDRNPASTNTLGFDAAVFPLDNPGNTIIGNNQTSATLRLTSNQEVYGLYLLGLAVEIYRPNLQPMTVTQTAGTNPANPGDALAFNLSFANNGNDNAVGVSIETTIPPQTTLQPIGALPNGITHTYDVPSGLLTFNIPDGVLDIGDPVVNIPIQLQINNACYFLEDDCNLSFDLQFTATYTGATSAQQIISNSTSDPASCEALPYSVTVNQPVANWATAPNALDALVDCDDPAALAAAQTLFPVPDICTFTLNKTSGPFVAGGCPNTGTYTNTWNFTDACGVTIADFVQTITVTDTTPPTASNPATLQVACSSNIPAPDTSVVTDAADNCSVPVVTFVSESSNNQTCPETITRTYRVADACGNAITVTQLIIVNDTIFPTASNPPTVNVSCAADIPAPDTSVVTDAADNCAPPVVAFVSDVSDNGGCPETITRTYSVTDSCGNAITVTQLLIINDDVVPTASDPATITVQCVDDIPLPDISVVTDAADNCSTPVVAFVSDVSDNQSCPETITRTYSVTDACGNAINVNQLIVVHDDIPPVANNPAPLSVSCVDDIPEYDTGVVEASDNCSLPIVTFVSDVSDNQSCPETITRTYSVTDACDNTIFVTQLIIVNDEVAPTASTPAPIQVQCVDDVPAPNVHVIADASDNCSVPLVTFVGETTNNGGCPETITRTYRVTDACDNAIEVQHTIIIQDDTPPVLVNTYDAEVFIACAQLPDVPELEFADNCTAQPRVVFSEEMTNITDEGYDVVRDWTVADDCNNESRFTQTIHVRSAVEVASQSIRVCATDPPFDLTTFIENADPDAGAWESSTMELLDGTVFDPSVAGTGEYEFIYTYEEDECSWTTMLRISVNNACADGPCIASKEDITISKLVTANNDGFNDFFEVDYILNPANSEPCDISVRVEIFNRWGAKVFSDMNYTNDWNGTSPSGALGNAGVLPSGTYYYLVTLQNSGYDTIQGFILLGTD